MKLSIPDNILLQLSEFISSNFALHFPKERWNDLERNIVSASKEFGFSDTEKFIQHIITSPLTRENVEILAANLTINETYFWREPQTFEALEQTIIPELIRSRQNGNKRLRIWSAGCSTGEEPYSIAIALKRTIPDIKNWNISILATDINPRILSRAATGEYAKWSFRGVPKWLKENYFVQKPDNKL
jgi:chemotaxis protein methyltransferase CheR